MAGENRVEDFLGVEVAALSGDVLRTRENWTRSISTGVVTDLACTHCLFSMKTPLPAFVLRCRQHGRISSESLSMAAFTPGVIPQLYQRPSAV